MSSVGTIFILAPQARIPKISYTDRSKLNEATNKILSELFISKLLFTHSIRFITGRCFTTTPLGTPVEPEV